ncbi:hypothetical protein MMC26_001436 [Xylographa opegraphella]|nr:hypothetical protein [Xylographa opegraphella]
MKAINNLYIQNNFYTRQADSIVHLYNIVLPQCLNLITSLHIYQCFPSALYRSEGNNQQLALYDEVTWNETWRIIASMDGLRILRSHRLKFWRLRGRTSQTRFLEPLKAVKQANVFEVEVPWAPGEVESPIGLGEVPFRILEAETVEEDRRYILVMNERDIHDLICAHMKVTATYCHIGITIASGCANPSKKAPFRRPLKLWLPFPDICNKSALNEDPLQRLYMVPKDRSHLSIAHRCSLSYTVPATPNDLTSPQAAR